MAVIDEPYHGPRFGADGLYIPLKGGNNARCKLGPYYERMPDSTNSIFAKGEDASGTLLTSLKVYVGVYAEGESIPFDDALPLSLE
mmetsp:Transcript_8211/g.13839  ORF Transcript_8211/g.13839 Transcript_8211/m.13839 type:complete len:86 (-) Transcript_8211:343-600(-)